MINNFLTNREIKRLMNLPRFTRGKTNLIGREVEFVDSASFVYMYHEIFKSEIYRFETSQGSPLIVDAGANIGLSVIWQKQQFPMARIVAIEADPIIFKVLKKNIIKNCADNVDLHHAALWDTVTNIEFSSQGADAGRAASYSSDLKNSWPTVRVPTKTLSGFLDEPVDLLKIDIEGAEYRVLTRCRQELTNVKRLFVEYHSFRNAKQELSELLLLLRNAGFRVQIQSVGGDRRPFMQRKEQRLMDMQLNIFGYRE